MMNEKAEIDFSIVTIVNNVEIYEGFRESLNKQEGATYEIYALFNLNGEFNSARKAYNSVLNDCSGKYVLFTHPDIRFENNKVLFNIKKQVQNIEHFGVIGAAGASYDEKNHKKRIIYSSMMHGKDKIKAGITIKEVRKVQTVDECFFLVERDNIQSRRFQEMDGWHLYAVDLCLDCILNNRDNFAVPCDIWHISDGKSLDEKYMDQLERTIKRFGKDFPIIYTTVKVWKTRGVLSQLYRRYYFVKQKVKRKMKWCR